MWNRGIELPCALADRSTVKNQSKARNRIMQEQLGLKVTKRSPTTGINKSTKESLWMWIKESNKLYPSASLAGKG
jgi:hypothetical protein